MAVAAESDRQFLDPKTININTHTSQSCETVSLTSSSASSPSLQTSPVSHQSIDHRKSQSSATGQPSCTAGQLLMRANLHNNRCLKLSCSIAGCRSTVPSGVNTVGLSTTIAKHNVVYAFFRNENKPLYR